MSEIAEMLATAIGTINKLTAERDALLAACRAAENWFALELDACPERTSIREQIENLAAAIALTEKP